MLIFLFTASANALPHAPSRLLVDYQHARSLPSIILAASTSPLFSFVPEAEDVPPPRGAVMTAYRIIVSNAVSGSIAWDSTKVKAKSATRVRCGATLAAGSYNYTAMWWDAEHASPSSSALFDVGPSEDEWSDAATPWYGGAGQRELRFRFNTTADRLVRLHVASPGGVVVYVDGEAVGDEAGVSAWTAFDKRIVYDARALETATALRHGGTTEHEVVLSIGSGFYSKPVGEAPSPTARFVLVITDATGAARFIGSSGIGRVEGRKGEVVADSVKLGTSIDWSMGPGEGWSDAALLPKHARPSGRLVPLTVPAATSRGAIRPMAVASLGNGTWHYTLPLNLVGVVRIAAAAYVGPGQISVQHCERLVASATFPSCVHLSGLEAGVIDEHTVPAGAGRSALIPRFTWHGFQHVFVSVSGGATFTGSLDALTARWATADLVPASSISFAADGGGAVLTQLQSMVHSSQLANMAGYIPTDCPTREKHGWLGDAQVTAMPFHALPCPSMTFHGLPWPSVAFRGLP